MKRLYKVSFLLFALFALNTSLFACGCVDTPSAKANANLAKTSYDLKDAELTRILESINNNINTAYSQNQVYTLNENAYTKIQMQIASKITKVKDKYNKLLKFKAGTYNE